MNVFEILKQQMIEADNKENDIVNKVEQYFNNGATIVIANKHFIERLDKHSCEWAYLLKCLKANNLQYNLA